MVSGSSYISLTKGLTPLLDRIGAKSYSRSHNWHSDTTIAKGAKRPATGRAECAPVFRATFDGEPDLKPSLQKEPSWLNPHFVHCMTVLWSSVSTPKKKPRAASSFPTAPRKSPRRA